MSLLSITNPLRIAIEISLLFFFIKENRCYMSDHVLHLINESKKKMYFTEVMVT